MTETKPRKTKTVKQTMNSGKLETVQNTSFWTSYHKIMSLIQPQRFEETATPANTSDNTQTTETKTVTKIKNDGKVASFRVSSALQNHFDQLQVIWWCLLSAGLVSLAL